MSFTDVNKGIYVNSFIRIALFPVGVINAATFRKYATRIQAFSSIPITHLTRFQQDNLKSKCRFLVYDNIQGPFKNQNWKQAKLEILFVDSTNVNSQFNDFQQHRKIHAVCLFIF